jgi:hypothetical protein
MSRFVCHERTEMLHCVQEDLASTHTSVYIEYVDVKHIYIYIYIYIYRERETDRDTEHVGFTGQPL